MNILNKQKLIGFTLAEVLITLGIIGVVAALTMPSLIQHHRRSVTETALKRFYSNINQAIKLSEIDNGETKDWDFGEDNYVGSENFFNKYLKNYVKVLKTDNSGGVYSDYYYPLFTIFFADGSGVSLNYYSHDWYYCVHAKDMEHFILKQGTSCFVFEFYPKTPPIKPYCTNRGGVEPFVEYAKCTGVDNDVNIIPNFYSGRNWAKAIQLNGWKIPEDYPLKF